MLHETEIKIRGYHIDVFGHVNNARHLEFLEEARWSILEERIGLDWLFKNAYLFVVVNININYRRPAFMDESLIIETTLSSHRTRSAILTQTAKLKGSDKVVTDAKITFVILNTNTQKPLKLEGPLLKTIRKMQA
ncbi:MAG: acyl-CoA thioesterase [Desulfobacteraceae bacterium]|nr:acyl-CoA thioesterase [Desulfobacteraceae bacterium]